MSMRLHKEKMIEKGQKKEEVKNISRKLST